MVVAMIRIGLITCLGALMVVCFAWQAGAATVLSVDPQIISASAPIFADQVFAVPDWPDKSDRPARVSPAVLVAHTCVLMFYALFIALALPRRRSSSNRFG